MIKLSKVAFEAAWSAHHGVCTQCGVIGPKAHAEPQIHPMRELASKCLACGQESVVGIKHAVNTDALYIPCENPDPKMPSSCDAPSPTGCKHGLNVSG